MYQEAGGWDLREKRKPNVPEHPDPDYIWETLRKCASSSPHQPLQYNQAPFAKPSRRQKSTHGILSLLSASICSSALHALVIPEIPGFGGVLSWWSEEYHQVCGCCWKRTVFPFVRGHRVGLPRPSRRSYYTYLPCLAYLTLPYPATSSFVIMPWRKSHGQIIASTLEGS